MTIFLFIMMVFSKDLTTFAQRTKIKIDYGYYKKILELHAV